MIADQAFTMGLSRIAIAVRESIDAATFAVYFQAIGEHTDPGEWDAFTLEYSRKPERNREGRPKFPAVAEILERLWEFRGARPLSQEATQAYERVLAASSYTPEGGAHWIYRHVLETCGRAAANAFLEAGGDSAFATNWNESKRRERFLAAYEAEVRERPNDRLLPEAKRGLLPEPGKDAPQEEASRLLNEIAKRVPGSRQPLRLATSGGKIVASEKRIAELKKQARDLEVDDGH